MIPLRTILQMNAISSGAIGALLIIFAHPIANIFDTTEVKPFWAIGIFLLIFACGVLYESFKHSIHLKRVQLIISLQISWVLTSFLAVGLLFSILPFTGSMLILAIALCVATMVYLLDKELKQLIHIP